MRPPLTRPGSTSTARRRERKAAAGGGNHRMLPPPQQVELPPKRDQEALTNLIFRYNDIYVEISRCTRLSGFNKPLLIGSQYISCLFFSFSPTNDKLIPARADIYLIMSIHVRPGSDYASLAIYSLKDQERTTPRSVTQCWMIENGYHPFNDRSL